ncbi:MAG: glycosyltransferase family 1 protein [Chloroflexi bacterium]|nr:MAG: glycosyltransferase family 1 protein [Chloroflexota bacterium]
MNATCILDARTVTHHFPGIGRYVVNLAQAMKALLAEGERLILLRDSASPSPWDLGALEGEKLRVIDVPIPPFSLRQQWVIPRLLHRFQASLYHSPYYLMPYRSGVPTVVTIYDFIPLLYPTYFSFLNRLIFRWATILALRVSAVAIVLSQATARDLRRFFAQYISRVEIIPAASDPRFRPQPAGEVERIRRKYAISEGYILYLGINKPHKNLTRLIEAWAQICKWRVASGKWQLIIAGAWDPRYPEPKQRAEELGLGDSVRFLGPVPEDDLPALYAGATLFVFPSLYEGFGLPVLEAMACGTPVACSNASSLPEVVGDAALTFDPADSSAIARAITRVLADAELRQVLRERGLAQAAGFSWERTAAKTLEVYRRAAGNKPT